MPPVDLLTALAGLLGGVLGRELLFQMFFARRERAINEADMVRKQLWEQIEALGARVEHLEEELKSARAEMFKQQEQYLDLLKKYQSVQIDLKVAQGGRTDISS